MFDINKYLSQAHARAKKRRNPWNLLIFTLAFIFDGVTWWALVALSEAIHLILYPGQHLQTAKGIGPIFAVIPPFLIVVPIGFIFGNFCIWLIPYARVALDREAGSDPHMTFGGSQRDLLKLSAFIVPIALAIMAIGISLNWS